MRIGFSLVELSIVLVILGLLTGGILAGQSLIRASEIRSVSTDMQSYITAIQTFRDKYRALPGDMTNAVSFWGQMTNCGVASPSGTGTQTCNGDGSGTLNAASAASRTGERFGFWQHLASAGLISGSYTGIASASDNDSATAGTNVPASKINSAVWYATTWNTAGNAINFAWNYENHLVFGAPFANGNGGVAISTEEAWGLDSKLDDGMPARGFIFATARDTCTNSTSATDYASTYLLTGTGVRCGLRIMKGF